MRFRSLQMRVCVYYYIKDSSSNLQSAAHGVHRCTDSRVPCNRHLLRQTNCQRVKVAGARSMLMRQLVAAAGVEGERAACGWLGRWSEARAGMLTLVLRVCPRAVLALQLSSVAAECQAKCRCFLRQKSLAIFARRALQRERVVERWSDASVQGQGSPWGLDGFKHTQVDVPDVPGLCAPRSMQAHARRSGRAVREGEFFSQRQLAFF